MQGGVVWDPNQPFIIQELLVGPGDYILQPGVPYCADNRDERAGAAAQELVDGIMRRATPTLAAFATLGGILAGQFVTQLQYEIRNTGGTIAQLLSDIGLSPRCANCGTAVLIVPAGYHVTSVVNLAKDENGPWPMNACGVQQPPYMRCLIPDLAFQNVQAGNVVISTVINWARETRRVRVLVYFAPNS